MFAAIPNLLSVFYDPVFWLQNSRFLLVFILVLAVSSYPVYTFTHHKLMWPVYGLINLLLLLLFWQNVVYFTSWPADYIFPFIFVSYLIECLLVWKFKNHRPSSIIPTIPKYLPLILTTLYASLFFGISAFHFDPLSHVFFPPGYELNHDAINIASSVKVLDLNLPPTNSFGNYFGQQVLHFNYPLGGTDLMLFFTKVLHTDVYFIYSRVILAAFLLTLFVVGYLLATQKLLAGKVLTCLLLVSVIVNYLTISFLNTSVLASTVIIPPILFSWVLIFEYITVPNTRQTNLLMLLCTLAAGIFLYIYIIVLYAVLFLFGLLLTRVKLPRTILIPLFMIFVISFCNPHNLLVTGTYLHRQFTSSQKEVNLLGGVQGNLGNYLSPFMATSLWYSNTNYLTQGMRVSNMWLAAAVLLLLVLTRPVIKHRQLIFILVFPCLVMLGLSFLTRSPYQNAKVLQLSAVIWPIIVYVLYYSNRFMVYPLIAIVMIGSGLYALYPVGKPVVAADRELMHLEPEICRDNSHFLTVIARDEWSKYFLMGCRNATFYLDRYVDYARLAAINVANHRNYISDPCSENSLSLPPEYRINTDRILIDRCFRLDGSNYRLVRRYATFNLYSNTKETAP